MQSTAHTARRAAVYDADADTPTFPIKVIMAGKPTRVVEIRHGTTLRELAALLGLHSSDRRSALLGTGDLVGPSYVLTPDDERVCFVSRLAGAQPA
jgi:hypothetical protein